MSKKGDRARRAAARKKYADEMRRWNKSVRLARQHFWDFEAIKSNKSRFENGTNKAKHLSGYWERVEEIAREKFGGRKPRPLPRATGLRTGRLHTGGLDTGGL